MLKPDSVEKGNIGPILEKINSAGFRIVAMKLTQMSNKDARNFYSIHRERPFFDELVSYMTRGPIVAAVLEKEDAVEQFRLLIGSTDPAAAAAGTIRKVFATSISENAIHGSDTNENALIEAIESNQLFVGLDVYQNEPTALEGPFDSPLARHANVYGTHHIGASTAEAQDAVAAGVVEVIDQFVKGHLVNCVSHMMAN